MTTKSPDELSIMTPEQIKAYLDDEARHVFGENYRRDRQGRPLEQGIGAPGNETETHFAALERAEGAAVAAEARRKAAARQGR